MLDSATLLNVTALPSVPKFFIANKKVYKLIKKIDSNASLTIIRDLEAKMRALKLCSKNKITMKKMKPTSTS